MELTSSIGLPDGYQPYQDKLIERIVSTPIGKKHSKFLRDEIVNFAFDYEDGENMVVFDFLEGHLMYDYIVDSRQLVFDVEGRFVKLLPRLTMMNDDFIVSQMVKMYERMILAFCFTLSNADIHLSWMQRNESYSRDTETEPKFVNIEADENDSISWYVFPTPEAAQEALTEREWGYSLKDAVLVQNVFIDVNDL